MYSVAPRLDSEELWSLIAFEWFNAFSFKKKIIQLRELYSGHLLLYLQQKDRDEWVMCEFQINPFL